MSNADFAQLLESSEGLTDQFKTEAAQLFESAVAAKVAEQVETKLAEQVETKVTELVEERLAEQVAACRAEVAEEMATRGAELVEEQVNARVEEQTSIIAESVKSEYLAEMSELTEKIAQLEDKVEEKTAECDEACNKLEQGINEEAAKLAAEKIEQLSERLVSYVDYVAEQYVSEHEQQIEESAKVFLAEGALDALRGVFAKFGFAPVEAHEHFEQKLAEVTRERDDAFAQLSEAIEAKFDLEHQIEESKKATAIAMISEGLTDVERTKLVDLMEGDTSDLEQFTSRAKILAESLHQNGTDELDLGVDEIITESVPETPVEQPKAVQPKHEQPKLEESIDPDVAWFVAALESNKSKY